MIQKPHCRCPDSVIHKSKRNNKQKDKIYKH